MKGFSLVQVMIATGIVAIVLVSSFLLRYDNKEESYTEKPLNVIEQEEGAKETREEKNSEIQEESMIDSGTINGEVYYVSDVANEPDSPVTDRSVSFIKLSDFDKFISDIESYYGTEIYREQNDFSRLQVGITDEIAEKYIVASPQLDNSGRFSISLNSGAYNLCLTVTREPQQDLASLSVLGCAEIVLSAGEVLNLDISLGELGIQVN